MSCSASTSAARRVPLRDAHERRTSTSARTAAATAGRSSSNVYNEPIDLFDRHLYEKGGWVLHMLRFELGDELFWKSIRHYAAEASAQQRDDAGPPARDRGGDRRNLDWFFDQWVYGAGHPELNVSCEWDDKRETRQADGQADAVEASNNTAEVFRSPVDVEFVFEGQEHQDYPRRLDEREQTFYFPLRTSRRSCASIAAAGC